MHAPFARCQIHLEQQRIVDQQGPPPGPASAPRRRDFRVQHQRMHQSFQRRKFGGIAHHQFPQLAAIDRIVHHHGGKRRADRAHRRAAGAVHRVHRGIGIEDGNKRAREGLGDGGFAHADPAGQPDDFHATPNKSDATNRRNSSSTTGVTPNHSENPGTP